MTSVKTRDSLGRWKSGVSGNPAGRLPRNTETEYLGITMGKATPEKWGEIVEMAVEDALAENPHVRARAREWLAKHLIGDPSTIHQMLYKEERSFEIRVIFGEDKGNGQGKLEDVIDVEPVMIDAN